MKHFFPSTEKKKSHAHGITVFRGGPEAHPNETGQPTRKRSFVHEIPRPFSNGRRFDHAPQLDHRFKIHHQTLGTSSSEDPQNAIRLYVPGDGEDLQSGERELVLDRGRESTSVRPGTSRPRGTNTQERRRTLHDGNLNTVGISVRLPRKKHPTRVGKHKEEDVFSEEEERVHHADPPATTLGKR